jgi:hypothetical protein
MDAIDAQLNRLGVDVFNGALMGHGANYLPQPTGDEAAARLASFARVTLPLWQDETYAMYHIAVQRSAQLAGVPLCLVAYSLGGLMGCTLLLARHDVHFDRIVLFAPGLRVRRHSYLLKALSAWPNLVFPSATPAAYRANRGTTIAAYNALYAAIEQFDRHLNARLNVPALLFCDPADELVSYTGLAQLIRERELTRWRLHAVRKGPDAAARYHHLIVDAQSVGMDVWGGMMAAMAGHLLG